MGRYTAEHAAQDLRDAIKENGEAYLIVATGASQFEVLAHLVAQDDIDWSRVHGFHLDEYIGIGRDHPASFCGYLKERFVDKVPLASFHYLSGDTDATETVRQAATKVSSVTVDVALVGIGENGHLAFNDPPADFETDSPYLIVELDHECRMQQVGEGWFGSLDEVPTHAISMSIQQILKTKKIYCSVPDERKAAAVRDTLCGPITPDVPASILRNHSGTTLIIDDAAASKIPEDVKATLERVE
ncbi:MAG: glucosamine-6-phosphate deaminase [Phycisphaera sp. RhM]|nr:glucosamine-6-phosphate deaminase [Phycisphaera sp. RhM]